MRTSSANFRKWIGGGTLGIIVLLPMFYVTDWHALLGMIATVDPYYFFISFVFFVLSLLFRALRVWRLGQGEGGIKPYLFVLTYHQFFLLMLPSRSGDISLPILLKRRIGRATLHGVSDLLHIRIDDLAISALFLLIGALSLPDAVEDRQMMIAGGVVLFAFGLLGRRLLIAFCNLVRKGGRGFRNLLSRRRGNWLQLTLRRLTRSLESVDTSTFIQVYLLGLFYMLASAFRIKFLFAAIAIDVSFINAILLLGAANLAGLIPVHGFGGLGPRLYAVALVLSLTGSTVALASGAALALQLAALTFTLTTAFVAYGIDLALPSAEKHDQSGHAKD